MEHPPRLATALLRWILDEDDCETIGGDLDEVYRGDIAQRIRTSAARLWYWRQVASIVAARLFSSRGHTHPSRKRTAMASLRQDLSYAVRTLGKQPGFTAIAVLTLALGIGANVAIFSLVNAVMFKPLPFAEPNRLMAVHLLSPDRDEPGSFRPLIWSFPKYLVLRESQQVFQSTTIFMAYQWSLTGTGSPERLEGELVEGTYLHVLGVQPRIGRDFTADETSAPGSVPVAILGYDLWQRRFGGDPGVLGRTLGLNGIAHTILGVLPPGFRGLTGQAELLVPVTTQSSNALGEAWNHSYRLVARLQPNVTPDQAIAAVRLLGDEVNAKYPSPGSRPDAGKAESGMSATAALMNDERIDPLIRRSVLLMLVAVGCVLLVVCVNLANLMLVRALAREREVAIRLALGASRPRIVRQFMTESVLLAASGALGGFAVAYALMTAGAALMPDLRMVLPQQTAGLTRVGLGTVGLDTAMLLFAIALATATAVLFGLGPAWRASRRDLTATMRVGSSGSVSQRTSGFAFRNLLIVGEIAIALVLLIAGGLMLKSVAKLQATELGFRPTSLSTFRLTMPSPQYNSARATQLFVDALDRLGARGEIEAIAYGSCAPLSGGCNQTSASFPGRLAPPARPSVGVRWASPKYFETLGIRLVRGRVFTDADRAGQPKVVVINEAAARAFWGDEDPIGQRIGLGQGGFSDGAEVVGIVADVRFEAVEIAIRPDVYLPLLQSARTQGLIFVRSRTAPEHLVPSVRAAIQSLDPDLPLSDIKTMDQRFGDATWRTRVSAWLLGVFAALAMALAAIGIYGVMSQGVAQRSRELGVRMALGATAHDVLRLILGRAVIIAIAGVAIGIALAIPSMKLIATLLYQVTPGDPGVLAGLAAMLMAVAVLASYLPARRATRVDPLTTLRSE